jgi:hypothetical protein
LFAFQANALGDGEMGKLIKQQLKTSKKKQELFNLKHETKTPFFVSFFLFSRITWYR